MGIQQHYRNLGESNNKSQRNIKKAAGDQRMCHLDGGKSATDGVFMGQVTLYPVHIKIAGIYGSSSP